MANRQILITPMDDLLVRFGNQLGSLGEQQARVVLARAVNRVTDMVHTRVVREIVRNYSIPRQIVRASVKKEKAAHIGNSAIQGRVYASGKSLSLKLFKPVQFSWGVRAKVWGRFERYEGRFINAGRWNSGNPAFGGHVMYRVGKDRFPVRRELGPAVPDALVAEKTVEVFDQIVRTQLPARVAHELNRVLI